MPSDEPDPYTVQDDALPDLDLNASTHPIRDTLQLESADPVTLFHALSAVERALPHLLLCLKPILASLTSSTKETLVRDHALTEALAEREVDEEAEEKDGAGRAVVDFLAIVDTALYLKATGASPSTLVPPPVGAIPTPFASTLPLIGTAARGEGPEKEAGPGLGLYASRIESRTLEDMVEVLEALRAGAKANGGHGNAQGLTHGVRDDAAGPRTSSPGQDAEDEVEEDEAMS